MKTHDFDSNTSRRSNLSLRMGCVLSAAFLSSAVVLIPTAVQAQTIHAAPSTTSCSLDEVINVNVTIKNPKQASMPEAPTSADYDIRFLGGPSTNQRTVFDGSGRVEHEVSYTYHFELRPIRTGRFRVESFTVPAGNRQLKSPPFVITVSQRIGATADLFCKVIAPRNTVFVGEPVNLTLEAWVRKYVQRGLGTLDPNSTFNRIEQGLCRFGVFAEAANQPARYREATLTDKSGQEIDYYVFSWETTFAPKSAGQLTFDDIQLAWSYPTRIRQSFFRIEDVQQPRHLRATPEAESITVRVVPLQGRPPYYAGAIGSFQMSARAAPTSLPVGDPVTLILSIQGDAPLDGISAPRLGGIPEITKRFEITAESPAGEIQGNTKIFSQTIRPLNENVRELPAIPFAYFNPETESYETAWTDPIPLRVRPAERIAVSTTDDDGNVAPPAATEIKTTDGLQANHADVEAMVSDQSVRIGPGTYALVGGLPLLYLAAMVVTRKRQQFRNDDGLRRRTRAAGEARKGLASAKANRRLGDVQNALLTYIADRTNEPAGGMTRAEAIERLGKQGVNAHICSRADELLAAMEMSEYAGTAGISVDDAIDRTRGLIGELERAKV